ncbi:unnamed protein product [Moneuplotes crassus]|uniref:Uncharacterized protein n=1 Tax=Euplotes crassus TaxID=5936 RepID=A0AAD1XTC2_EUPCR|nr:unnamed protein product [Moneuplotes crassus]
MGFNRCFIWSTGAIIKRSLEPSLKLYLYRSRDTRKSLKILSEIYNQKPLNFIKSVFWPEI